MFKGTYISNEVWHRDKARDAGYCNVDAHPRRIGTLNAGEFLLLDGDNILFDDLDEAVTAAIEHARRGVHVGIHSASNQPRLAPAHAKPSIVVARTHREVLAALELRVDGRTSQSEALPDEPSAALTPEEEEYDLLLWLEAAQAEIASDQAAELAVAATSE